MLRWVSVEQTAFGGHGMLPGLPPIRKVERVQLRKNPRQWPALFALILSAALPLASQTIPAAAGPDLPERLRWETLHRSVQSAAFTDEACAARFATQIMDARAAAQAYLQAVAADTVFWAREREQALPPAPNFPALTPALELLEAEAAEEERRLNELESLRALSRAVAAVRAARERSRFGWRALPETLAAMETRAGPLVAHNEMLRIMLKARQVPLQAELQRLQVVYDLLETEVSRSCARSAQSEAQQDPFAVPEPPVRRPPARRKK